MYKREGGGAPGTGAGHEAAATPTAIQGNPIETKDAAQRWDAISGNTATGIAF